MADDPKPAETKPVQSVRFLRSKDFRNVFANTFRMRNNGYDVGIAFGYQSEIPSAGPLAANQSQVILTDEVEVAMTPVALKLLHMAILQNIEAIEAVNGKPIDLPQALLDNVAAQRDKMIADLKAEMQAAAGTERKSS